MRIDFRERLQDLLAAGPQLESLAERGLRAAIVATPEGRLVGVIRRGP